MIERDMNELAWTKVLWQYLQDDLGQHVLVGRERQLWDRTRVDILTPELAVEVDWAPKHAEAIGQSVWYAINTDRQAGVCLLVKDSVAEAKYIYRCKAVCVRLNLTLWLVDVAKGEIIIAGTRYKLPVE